MNILEVELQSDNLSETEKFYKNVLGLSPIQKEGNDLLFFKIGGTELIFKKSVNEKPVYHFAIDVPNNRFFDCHNFIAKTTKVIEVEPGNEIANFANWDAKSFYFYDNNGNIVEMITRYPTRAYDADPFSYKTYMGLSEVALVTSRVAELSDVLIKEQGIPVFKRQPRRDDFTALGDDEGLILVSERGRNWYPTNIPAQSFPIRVVFMVDGIIEHIAR
jgi:catechol 2,3-dioxygenase-like lactoylglutathione lyase family enzyme